VTIPLLAHRPGSWFETTIPQFNELIRSFTMDGSNTSTSKLVIEEGLLALRSTDPKQPLKNPFHFEPRSVLIGALPPEAPPEPAR
jgi:hypothetical protein